MDKTRLSRNIHLMSRAGFGPAAEDLPELGQLTSEQVFRKLLKDSGAIPQLISVTSNSFDGLIKGVMNEGKMQELSREQKAEVRKQSREGLKDLNLRWLDEMVHSKAQLREKMAFFWHGHFACRQINIFFQQELLDIIRKNALSDFGTLLREVSKSAAMLSFLNNQQNRKRQPNENFAREVMELFTMGRGNYSETDVKEAARAFTGWGFDLGGTFTFRKQFHDEGSKTVLGNTGAFDGDDIIDILLRQKQTAHFIARKIYIFFVEETPNEERIKALGERFYASSYDINDLLKNIFTASWFYEPQHMGVIIKSPVQLLAGTRRLLPMKFQNEEVQLLYQRLLGQVLFYPPNVAGWPGGRNWIDSSSLMYRLRLPRMLNDNEAIASKPKDDDDVMMGQAAREAKGSKMINVDVEWPVYTSAFNNVKREELAQAITLSVLSAGQINIEKINALADKQDRIAYIRSVTIQLMSRPEYQLM